MSDYAHVPGGSLKFKGGDSTKKKKKKSSTHTTSAHDRKDAEASIAESSKTSQRSKALERDGSDNEGEKRTRRKDSDEGDEDREVEAKPKASAGRHMTDAERKFEEIQRRRRTERVAKTANMSHKDRVTEFNSKLDKLTEHNDIPKISWTG